MHKSTQQTNDEQIPLSKLRWHCRRGVKELDVVLNSYLENHYVSASKPHQQAFLALIQLEDPILLDYLMGQAQPDDPTQQQLLAQLKNPF